MLSELISKSIRPPGESIFQTVSSPGIKVVKVGFFHIFLNKVSLGFEDVPVISSVDLLSLSVEAMFFPYETFDGRGEPGYIVAT